MTDSILYSQEPLNSWEKIQSQVQNSSASEQVVIDNLYIQSYQEQTGVWKKVPSGSLLSEIAKPYQSDIDSIIEINNFPKNAIKVFAASWIFIPYTKEYINNLKINGISRLELRIAHEEYIWPVEGIRITSHLGQRWGKFHPGVDIATPSGSLVLAAMDGEITESRFIGEYGNAIILNHNQSYFTLYGHLSDNFVKKGDKVRKGQVIGLSGSTGHSTGPHLHFEVRYLNIVLNPEVFLPAFRESIYVFARKESNDISTGVRRVETQEQ